jgi:phosphatidate cytidylyltransferase
MLGQRIVTAVVLLALLIPALLSSNPWPFLLMTLALIGAAGWEWGRLNGAAPTLAVALGLLLVGACAGAAWAGWTVSTPAPVWWAAALLWVVGGGIALRHGPAGWPHLSQAVRWAIGLVVLWAAWLALGVARAQGVAFILSVFCVVWVADIAAYFGGRAFGRHKLAPSISPGKTWEGVWSGMVGVMLLAAGWLALAPSDPTQAPSVFSQLLERHGWVIGAAMLALMAAMSVVGDLFESLVKRAAGAKDSSRLLPGHGGVLDRVDALLPVFPLALALVSWGQA